MPPAIAPAQTAAKPKLSASAIQIAMVEASGVQIPVEFRCFEIPDRFVIGFGLDHNQLYRNLGYVAVMKPDKSA